MPPPPSSVLYYPTIDIRNENWLRTASLFWESIRTIVPDGFANPYSMRFAQELHDEGILDPIAVNSDMEEIEALSDDVLDYLTDPASAGLLFGSGGQGGTLLHPKKLPRKLREISEIHPAKLPYLIREHLNDALSDRGFAQVDSGFAAFYMTILAKQLAGRLGIGLVTDSGAADQFSAAVRRGRALRNSEISPDHRRFGRYYEASGPRRNLPREIATGAMFDLMVEGIKLPENVTARELIKFRRSHSEELALLRREVMRLVGELPEELSIEAFRQSVQDQYEHAVRPGIRSLRASLTRQGWNTVPSGFLKASFLSAAPTSALAVLHVAMPVAILAGAGISLTATAINLVTDRRRTLEANPYSYLLSIERKW